MLLEVNNPGIRAAYVTQQNPNNRQALLSIQNNEQGVNTGLQNNFKASSTFFILRLSLSYH
jgi:hypothetical protein